MNARWHWLSIGLVSLALAAAQLVRAEEPAGVAALVPVLKEADDADFQLDILKGMAAGLEGNRHVPMPPGWSEVAQKLAKSPKPEVRDLSARLSILFGDPATTELFRTRVVDHRADPKDRLAALTVLLSVKDAHLPPVLQALLRDPTMAQAALKGLASYDDAKTPEAVLAAYPKLPESLRPDALATLSTREPYALRLLAAIKAGTIPRTDLSAVTMQQLKGLGSPSIDRQIEAVWGVVRGSSAEKKEEIARLKALLKTPPTTKVDLSLGRALFMKTCHQCHTLYGDGGKVGPDLTGSHRADLDYLLLNVVDPSAILAKDYQMSIVRTEDGRSLSGIVSKQDDTSITLVMPNETLNLLRTEIEAIKLSDISLMPEGQLSKLSEADLRNLIGYLQNPVQVPLPPASPKSAESGLKQAAANSAAASESISPAPATPAPLPAH
ncbi:MAG TPA: hypothetical protein VFE24_01980 [Pirellulales bacterium]|jgi:putative heme-binding domain-containing protein|nr:hypothetical protein [Pirellulales bacterium]